MLTRKRFLMKANETIFALVAAGVAGAVTVPVAAASAHSGAKRQIAEARTATAQFHNVDTARVAGYLPAEHCVEEPGLGAMGFHNPNLGLMDLAVDHRKPELLLYAPKKNGGTRLVAVEYFVPFVGQLAPELFGERFDGPMPYAPATSRTCPLITTSTSGCGSTILRVCLRRSTRR